MVETEAPRINKYDEFIQNLKEEIHEINEKIVVETEQVNGNINNSTCDIINNSIFNIKK